MSSFTWIIKFVLALINLNSLNFEYESEQSLEKAYEQK